MGPLWERWKDAVSTLPADGRPPDDKATRDLLEKLFRFAPAQAEFLLSEPEILAPMIRDSLLEHDFTITRFQRDCAQRVGESGPDSISRIRRWKRGEFFRIALRDLAAKAPVQRTISELSDLACVTVEAVLREVQGQMSAKPPSPATPFAVLGLGKLGGNELNYSSDIDLIYIYEDEGQSGPLTHHEWFGRLTRSLTQELARRDTEGAMYRVDLRLRPEGNSGPIVHSLDSCEHYYAAFGETWERLALGKARGVAGDRELAYEFCQRLQPFIYPRSIPAGIVDEVYQLKKRIEEEVVGQGALERHVKLGRGGIREIEFITQTLQLLHGARHPFLQENGTLRALEALNRLELLSPETLRELAEAYRFLRQVEHRLQMRYDLQTHTLPADWEKSSDLRTSLGYDSAESFASDLRSHQQNVRNVFDSLLEDQSARPPATRLDWPAKPAQSLLEELQRAGLKDPSEAYESLRALARGPAFVHTAPRTKKLFARLWPGLLAELPKQARPDLCLKQLERFTEAYGTRSALFEILLRRPKLLEILFLIFDNSRYLTDTVIRHPEFIEDIALTGTLDYRKTPADVSDEIQAMLKAGLPLEKVLRLTKRSELLRIELRAMMGKDGLDVTMQEWSELAEATLQMATKNADAGRDFAVIAMGKFGGKELSNGSDLDLLFVGEELKKAVRIIRAMTETTEDGIVFPIDTRLRPYGDDGQLTVPIETYHDYYNGKAQLWERLALTRARAIAGDPALCRQFEELIVKTIYTAPVTRGELQEIFAMRKRIEEERATKALERRFNADYKTGKGGLVDLEFMTQISQLVRGFQEPDWRTPNTLHLLKLGGWSKLSENYLFLRRMEFSLRRFHLTEESSIPQDSEQQWILSRHMGFKNFADLLKVYEPILKENRAGFEEFRKSLLK